MNTFMSRSRLEPDDIRVSEMLVVLWRRKWVVLLITFLAASGAFVVSRSTPPVYEASTTVLVDLASQFGTSEFSAIAASERGVRTYAQLISQRPVLEETLTRLNLDMSRGALSNNVSADLIENTQLIELKVQDTSPLRAANLANTIVEVFSEQNEAFQAGRFSASKASLTAELDQVSDQIQLIEAAIADLGAKAVDARTVEYQRLEAEIADYQVSYLNLLSRFEELRIAEAQSFSNLIHVEPAEPPNSPIRPLTVLNTMMAAAVGAAIAVAAVFLVEHLDDSIKGPQDIAKVSGLQVFAYVTDTKQLASRDTRRELIEKEPDSIVAESFRSLRTNIELAGNQGNPKSLLISSPGQGDGKTTVAAQLAMSIAQGGKKVVLIDANLRQPALHHYFSIGNELGLSDMLLDDLVPQVTVQETMQWRLKIITAGRFVDNPAELMASIYMLKALSRLREQFDIVIFDSPPLVLSETFVLASKLETVLLVIRYGKTREWELERVFEHLDRAQANTLGIVMNRTPRRLTDTQFGRLPFRLSRRSRFFDEPNGGKNRGRDGAADVNDAEKSGSQIDHTEISAS